MKSRSLSFMQMTLAAMFVMASVASLKVTHIGPLIIPAGVILYALTKPLLDIITELWGGKVSQITVWYMAAVRTIVFAIMFVIYALPTVQQTPGLSFVLLGSIWVFIAGVLSELAGMLLVDNPIFMKLNGKVSFLWKQILSDVSVFVSVGTFVLMYKLIFPATKLLPMFIGQSVVTLFIAFCLAPIAVLVVRKINGTRQTPTTS